VLKRSRGIDTTGIKTATLWPEGILYYGYSDEFLVEEKAFIEWAIFDLQHETCLRFVRRTTEPTYILLRKADLGYVQGNGSLERRPK
jgi:hypothetical protein